MPITTILLHMSNDERHQARLKAGIALARRFDAYLEVLYIATPISMPAATTGRGASYAYIAEATAIAHEKAGHIEHEVREACADISYSWTVVEGDHLELLARRAAFADLAVVTQSHPAHLEDRVRLHVPDELPVQAACPTLVLPWNGHPEEAEGRHLLIAWKNTREATRAVRDAMPFLRTADKVTILTIDPPDDTGHDHVRDLMVFLERHGIRTQHHCNIGGGAEIGEVILGVARDLSCDGIVMGAYGHSRLRQLVLGGVTRHILAHMHVPVLMSH